MPDDNQILTGDFPDGLPDPRFSSWNHEGSNAVPTTTTNDKAVAIDGTKPLPCEARLQVIADILATAVIDILLEDRERARDRNEATTR